MSDLNSIAVSERTSLNVYDADIFNCSRHLREQGLPRNFNLSVDQARIIVIHVSMRVLPPGDRRIDAGFHGRLKQSRLRWQRTASYICYASWMCAGFPRRL